MLLEGNYLLLDEDGWRELLQRGIGAALHAVGDERGQHGGLRLQVQVVDGCGQAGEVRPAGGVGKVIEVGAERVPLQVVAERGAPAWQQFEHVGRREVELALMVAVVYLVLRGVAIHVVGVVVGILGLPARAEQVADALVEVGLKEGVQVALALASPPHVVDDGARNASLRVVDVALELPSALVYQSVQVQLQALGVYVAVLAGGGGVVGHAAVLVLAAVAELVLAAGGEELGVHRRAEPGRELLLPEGREAQHVARCHLGLELQVARGAVAEVGCTGAYVDGACVAEVAGGLEDGALLSVVERYFLDVVERELSQVYLSVLGVAQLDAVVADAQVVGAHGANVDGLDAAHAAIVLQLYA